MTERLVAGSRQIIHDCFPECEDDYLKDLDFLASRRPDMMTPADFALLASHNEGAQ